ncbi:cysteine proteinase RD21a-like [Hibiscus syriacus]|uniref:Cysteine proteinase RD21a-like n=1 Tax=Hibiscus syriacus TaxID=106335 RepID=A0A6A2WEY9_HIBSY|nr:cysteine proteinase RD21a-like [Hibiscus syriacus]
MISGIHGLPLEVTVVGCYNLEENKWVSRQDTSVLSMVVPDGGKKPIFQEKFLFALIEGLRELNVVVWNSSTLIADDIIGSGRQANLSLDLSETLYSFSLTRFLPTLQDSTPRSSFPRFRRLHLASSNQSWQTVRRSKTNTAVPVSPCQTTLKLEDKRSSITARLCTVCPLRPGLTSPYAGYPPASYTYPPHVYPPPPLPSTYYPPVFLSEFLMIAATPAGIYQSLKLTSITATEAKRSNYTLLKDIDIGTSIIVLKFVGGAFVEPSHRQPFRSLSAFDKNWANYFITTTPDSSTGTAFPRPELIQWRPAPAGWFTLNTNGAVHHTSSLGSAGGLIRNKDGDWIIGFNKAVSISSPLQAELWAILKGLQLAWSQRLECLQCQTDCAEALALVTSPIAASSPVSLVRSIASLISKQ